MTNKPPLSAGTTVYHSHFGEGRILCQYWDATVGDMVEVHWVTGNTVLDHREENLRMGLTVIRPQDIKLSPWLQLEA